MSEDRLVYSSGLGDLRKKAKSETNAFVNEAELTLNLRRLTSGKGRTIIEITALPDNKKWCQKLAQGLKKSLGVGGTFKNNTIEIHGEKIDQVTEFLNKKSLKWKKIGG